MAIAVVSDLHLGSQTGRDLLRRPAGLEALLDAVREFDELVLLGDVVELREAPVGQAIAAATPVLERIGEVLAGRPVTIVPGNHDHRLAAPITERAQLDGGAQLEPQTVVDPPLEGPLAAIADALGRSKVRLAYPGVWLRDDVYATHGHYLDVDNTVPTFERLGIGLVARTIGGLPPGRRTASDYEAAVAPVYELIYALAQSSRGGFGVGGASASIRAWQLLSGDDGRSRIATKLLGGVALTGFVGLMNVAGLGPLKPDLSGVELRRAALRGMASVVERLGIEARHVIFGHTHRSGPHPGDEGWELPSGGRMTNTGSWIDEPAFYGPVAQASPYWPGRIGVVADEGPPELRSLLDSIPPPT